MGGVEVEHRSRVSGRGPIVCIQARALRLFTLHAVLVCAFLDTCFHMIGVAGELLMLTTGKPVDHEAGTGRWIEVRVTYQPRIGDASGSKYFWTTSGKSVAGFVEEIQPAITARADIKIESLFLSGQDVNLMEESGGARTFAELLPNAERIEVSVGQVKPIDVRVWCEAQSEGSVWLIFQNIARSTTVAAFLAQIQDNLNQNLTIKSLKRIDSDANGDLTKNDCEETFKNKNLTLNDCAGDDNVVTVSLFTTKKSR